MTKTEAKKIAREEILQAFTSAHCSVWEGCKSDETTEKEKELISEQINKEMAHLEKRYNYAVGSWGRGY